MQAVATARRRLHRGRDGAAVTLAAPSRQAGRDAALAFTVTV
jgi:hypothetical protein